MNIFYLKCNSCSAGLQSIYKFGSDLGGDCALWTVYTIGQVRSRGAEKLTSRVNPQKKITFSIANGLGTVARRRFAGGVGLVWTWGVGRGRIRHRSLAPVLISVQLTKHFISLALAHAPKLHRWTKIFLILTEKKIICKGQNFIYLSTSTSIVP